MIPQQRKRLYIVAIDATVGDKDTIDFLTHQCSRFEQTPKLFSTEG